MTAADKSPKPLYIPALSIPTSEISRHLTSPRHGHAVLWGLWDGGEDGKGMKAPDGDKHEFPRLGQNHPALPEALENNEQNPSNLINKSKAKPSNSPGMPGWAGPAPGLAGMPRTWDPQLAARRSLHPPAVL